MGYALTARALRSENRCFAATGGISANSRAQGFQPAFCDTETGQVAISCFADGRQASVHVLEGVPEDWVTARDAAGRVVSVRTSVVSGFVRGGCFFTRAQAAELAARPGRVQMVLHVSKSIPKGATGSGASVSMDSRLKALIHRRSQQQESHSMPRILPVSPDQADPKTAAALKATEAKLGMLPNLFTTLARAPAALNGYLQLGQALGQGRLSARQRELIAIAVAQENACAYCLSAHAAIGQSVGLSDEDIERARHGGARDAQDDAITDLALRIVQSRADISDSTLAEARRAGLDDGLIIEIITHVALNVLTNYVNRIAGTEVDFPVFDLSPAA
jgi:uncharacterized peroxidase-related enzyme